MSRENRKRGGKLLPTLCGVLGTLILLAVILSYLPLTLPQLFGWEVYHVESPSMSPTIPQGSAVWVRPAEPEQIEPEDVIAFDVDGATVVHRVVQNRVVEGTFITRGDANPTDDPTPTPYAALRGRMEYHVPVLGALLAIYASPVGKIYAVLLAASGLLFLILAGRLRAKRSERLREQLAAELTKPSTVTEAQPSAEPRPETARAPRRAGIIALVVILLVVFVGSGVALLLLSGRYQMGQTLYRQAVEHFVQSQSAEPTDAPTLPEQTEEPEPTETAPIRVDFDALRAINPDVVGWIYCADTPINYPLLQGKTNDSYLRTGYDGSYCYAGSIFLDAENRPDLTDDNTIVYGHNLRDGAMFACLQSWADEDFFTAHPTLWILTPTGDYRVELFAGYLTDAYDEVYRRTLPLEPDREAYVSKAIKRSDVKAAAQPAADARLVLLSTCAYESHAARYVLHGVLIPIGSGT